MDATKSKRIRRNINDSGKMYLNSVMKKILVNETPRLCLFAKKDIDENTEIRYDFRERSSVLPWHKEVC